MTSDIVNIDGANVLNITSILPAPVKGKENENDVLLTLIKHQETYFEDTRHFLIFTLPYSNAILSFFSRKWASYWSLIKKGEFLLEDRVIYVLAVPQFRNDSWLKPWLNRIGFFINRRRIENILKSNKIDLIHAQDLGIGAGIADLASQRYGIPYVVTARGIEKHASKTYFKRLLQNARHLIVLNFAQSLAIQQLGYSSTLLPHGVDNNFFEKPIFTKNVQQPIKIVTVSRLLDWKNIDKIIVAVSKLKISFKYHIFGAGPELHRLTELVNSLGIQDDVVFKGKVGYKDMPKLLSQYDFFVLVSYPETFGRVYVEAMARGLPIIGVKGCGIDGYIENGKQGFLVNHQDETEILNRINRLAEDSELRQQMGKAAENLARSFSWHSISEILYKIYRSVI